MDGKWKALDGGRRDGLAARMQRAIRLDPALYREVAASGSTRQASVVVLITALISGLAWFAVKLPYWALSGPEAVPDAWGLAALAGLKALAQVCAWLVWTGGLWIVGGRLVKSSGQMRPFWPLARALAFGQSPAMFALVTLALTAILAPLLGLESLRDSPARMLVWVVEVGISLWVIVASFLAVREVLELNNGQTLGSMFLVGLAISGLTSFSATALIIASAHDALSPGSLADLPKNMVEFGVLAAGGLLTLFGSLFVVRWIRESDSGCLIGAVLVPAGLAIAVLLGLNYSGVSWSTPGIVGVVAPRGNVAELSALTATGLWLIYWILVVLRGFLRLDSIRPLIPVGLATVVLLGLGVTTLALVESVFPDVVSSITDIRAVRAVTSGFDFNFDAGVSHCERFVRQLAGFVLE